MDEPRPTCTQHDLTHYRETHKTYLDCRWTSSDLNWLPPEARYTWMRLISGPEMKRAGVSVNDLDPRDFNHSDLLTDLRILSSIGAVKVGDGLITFPNLRWGTPPKADVDDEIA